MNIIPMYGGRAGCHGPTTTTEGALACARVRVCLQFYVLRMCRARPRQYINEHIEHKWVSL